MKRALGCWLLACLAAGCGEEGPTFILSSDAASGNDAGAADGESADVSEPSDADTATDVTADTATDVTADTAPDVTADTAPDVAADTAPDVAADTAPDVTADTTPDVAADTAPDVTADTAPDVTADTAPDVTADTAPDVTADTAPDVTADTAPDAAPDTTPDATPFECGDGVTFAGQVFRGPDAPAYSPNGGTPTTTPFSVLYDAGIRAALEAGPTDDSRVAVDLPIFSATVSATSFNTSESVTRGQSQFWVTDGVDSMQLFLPRDESLSPPFIVQVGQRISFRITELGAYQGVPQVTAATDWVLESSDNVVYIRDLTTPLELEDVGDLVRITGTIGAGTPCGGSANCYPLTASSGAPTATLRSTSTFLAPGDCVTYVGPVFVFADVLQLDTVNFDWLLDYTTTDAP